MKQNVDVAVIGAGVAGNALAKSLADFGWQTMLIERKSFPRHKVCGEFLSPEALSMLNDLGVSDRVLSLYPRLIDRASIVLNEEDPLHIPLPGNALGLSRYCLDSALLSAASNSGVHITTATTVTSISPSNDGYLIEANQRGKMKICKARVVIAAWGVNGLKRSQQQQFKRLRPHRNKKTFVGVKSHFEGIDMDSVVELYFIDGGYIGISPIEDGLVNIAALLSKKSFQHTPKTVLGWIDAACSRNEKLHRKLAKATPVPNTQAAIAPIDLNRKPQAWDLFPNVGDAVTMIPPLCGDGMSMALRSSQLCAPLANRYLKGEISLIQWQKQYSHLIHQHFQGPRQWGRLFQWLVGVPYLPRFLLHAARFSPRFAHGLVKVTRLKEN